MEQASTTTESTEQATTEATQEQAAPQGQTFDAEYVAKLRQEAAKYRTQAKEFAEKAKRFDEVEESSKSELQKAIERAEKAEQAAAELRTQQLRFEVAQETGVPAQLLSGTTADELKASAEALLEFKGKSAAPAADFGAGNRGEPAPGKPAQYTREQMARMTPEQIVDADAAGHFDDLRAGRL